MNTNRSCYGKVDSAEKLVFPWDSLYIWFRSGNDKCANSVGFSYDSPVKSFEGRRQFCGFLQMSHGCVAICKSDGDLTCARLLKSWTFYDNFPSFIPMFSSRSLLDSPVRIPVTWTDIVNKVQRNFSPNTEQVSPELPAVLAKRAFFSFQFWHTAVTESKCFN